MAILQLEERDTSGELSRAALANIEERRRMMVNAKAALVVLLRDSATKQPLALCHEIFERHHIPSEYTRAALRELERDGLVGMSDDFSYHLTVGSTTQSN